MAILPLWSFAKGVSRVSKEGSPQRHKGHKVKSTRSPTTVRSPVLMFLLFFVIFVSLWLVLLLTRRISCASDRGTVWRRQSLPRLPAKNKDRCTTNHSARLPSRSPESVDPNSRRPFRKERACWFHCCAK